MATFRRRAQAAIFEHEGTITIVDDDGKARRFDPIDTPLLRAVLECLVTPCNAAAIAEAAAKRLERETSDVKPLVPGLLALLLELGVVVEVDVPTGGATPHAEDVRPVRICLGLTGAVATLFAAPLVQLLLARGFVVRVVMTATAERFVGPQGLEALTHQPVHTHMWHRDPSMPVPHVSLAEWADLVLVCPASATTLSRLAHGDFGDLVAAVTLTTRAPVVLVPSMNHHMYTAPSVRRNLAVLDRDGFYLVYPALGHEVAQRPEERTPVHGSAPSMDLVCRIVSLVLRDHGHEVPGLA